jgi:hypothetical protein
MQLRSAIMAVTENQRRHRDQPMMSRFLQTGRRA